MINYRLDILAALKEAGYSSYRLRAEKIIGQKDMQRLRDWKMVSWANINKLCGLLNCQPGDLLQYIPDPPEEDETKYLAR